MIFPQIRISELERDLKRKQLSFHNSQQQLTEKVHEKMRPMAFLMAHPKLITGFLLSVFTSARFLKLATKTILGKKTGKNGIIWKLVKAGWVWKLARPIIMGTVQKFFSDFKQR